MDIIINACQNTRALTFSIYGYEDSNLEDYQREQCGALNGFSPAFPRGLSAMRTKESWHSIMRAQTCTKWLADENRKKGEEDAAVEKNTHLSNRATPPGIYNQASLLIKEFRYRRNVGGKFKYARRILVVRVVIVLDVVVVVAS